AHLRPSGGELGPFLFAPADRTRYDTPLLETWRRAHHEQAALYYRPYTGAEGFAAKRGIAREAFLERIAPLNNAKNITKPLFIVQGKNDPRVPATEAQQMFATLKESNVPVWFLMANDEGHGFAKKKNADYLFYATVLFIKTFLLD
ncbi:hypothetical protein EHM92_03015, partial [bacterium]